MSGLAKNVWQIQRISFCFSVMCFVTVSYSCIYYVQISMIEYIGKPLINQSVNPSIFGVFWSVNSESKQMNIIHKATSLACTMKMFENQKTSAMLRTAR